MSPKRTEKQVWECAWHTGRTITLNALLWELFISFIVTLIFKIPGLYLWSGMTATFFSSSTSSLSEAEETRERQEMLMNSHCYSHSLQLLLLPYQGFTFSFCPIAEPESWENPLLRPQRQPHRASVLPTHWELTLALGAQIILGKDNSYYPQHNPIIQRKLQRCTSKN